MKLRFAYLLVIILTGGAVASGPVVLMEESFRQGELVDGLRSELIPAGWSYYGWHSRSRIPRGGLCPGKGALKVLAVEAGMAGWHSLPLVLPRPPRPLTLSVRYRTEADYAGNEPVCFLGWYDKNGRLLKPLFWKLPLPEKGKTIVSERVVSPNEFPSGTVSFSVNLVSRAGTPGVSGAGGVVFDRVRITMPPLPAASLRLCSDREGNWWKTGETVAFSVKGKLPENTAALTGTVRDSDGRKIAEIRVSAAELMREGWRWRPAEPGFYEIAFSLTGKDGTKTPVCEEYSVRSAAVDKIGVFSRGRVGVAVVPSAPKGPVSELFGFQLSFSPRNASTSCARDLRLARLVGASFVRFHVQWFQLEPERGKFDWKALDAVIGRCVASGLKPVIGFFGTPRWASRRPDDLCYIVHLYGYTGYAAKDLADWEHFVEALVKRYRDRVDTWEVWNEPHLPTFSCYWHDSPENFVAMLKSAHAAIKRVQPKSDVWLGGIGMRYLPFYHRIVELGAGRYFDTLALHGFGVNPAPFHAFDREFHSPSHPWVTSEWHGCLMRYGDAVYKLDERERSLRMLLDLLRQIGYGAERVSFFELTNLSEKETLAFFAAGKMPLNHNSGLFRRRPSLQPMPGAVVMHNFIGLFRGKVRLTGEFTAGSWKAVTLSGDAGPVLVFWHDGSGEAALDPSLAAAVGPDVIDWEGKPVNLKPGVNLESGIMYFCRRPALPGSLKKADRILTMRRRKLALRGPAAVYGCKPLLDKSGRFLPENAVWVASGWRRRYWKTPSGKVSARYALGFHGDWIDLAVEVQDPVHNQPESGALIWKGDGIQFAFDATGKGYPEDRCEFQAALTSAGPFLFKEKSPDLAGDLPTAWTPPGGKVEYGSLNVTEPEPGRMLYLVRLRRSELYPLVSKAGDRLRFSLLVNDNNGHERAGWLGWGDGIGDAKNPVLYGTLTPEKP